MNCTKSSKVSSQWPLTGIFVRRATNALDVKHITEVIAKPATCLQNSKLTKYKQCASLGRNYYITF